MAYISNYTNDSLIAGTTEADDIRNYSSQVTISASAGDDYIYNSSNASLTSINAGDGDDDIYNLGANVTILAGADSIYNQVQRRQ